MLRSNVSKKNGAWNWNKSIKNGIHIILKNGIKIQNSLISMELKSVMKCQ